MTHQQPINIYEKLSVQYLSLICDESLTCQVLNLNPRYFDGSTTFTFVSCRESCLLISWCTDDRCSITGSDENLGRSRRHGAEDWRWSSTGRVLGGRMIERSGDAVCYLHREHGDEERVFLG
jgi:hypothetical protein